MKRLFLLILVIFLMSLSIVKSYETKTTYFNLETDCSIAGCNAWIEATGDSLPVKFELFGDGTNDVKIKTWIQKWDWVEGQYVSYEAYIIRVTTQNSYLMGETPKIEKVIYNGMKVEPSECHWVNEADYLGQIKAICHISDELAYLEWNIGTEPFWLHQIKDTFDAFSNTINNIWDEIDLIWGNITSTTTIIPSNIEERLSFIESAICQIKYIDGFCPPKCSRPYRCMRTCEDQVRGRWCYNRTIYEGYFCSSGRVCCESVRELCE